jgi:hypothetical protein
METLLLQEAEYQLDQAELVINEYLQSDNTSEEQDFKFLKAQEQAELAYQKIYNAVDSL